MRKLYPVFLLIFLLDSCSVLEQLAGAGSVKVSKEEVAKGLKEALSNGVRNKVTTLSKENGFYSNPSVKIHLSGDLEKLEKKMTSVGLGYLTDEGVKLLNRAAEDATKDAVPVFIQAIKELSIQDAFSILKGTDTAATSYLRTATQLELYDRFYPVVTESLEKVGANQAWKTIIVKYNVIPFVNKVNPDLNDFVTQKTLEGIYTMIAQEEKLIRGNLSMRNTDLLKKVFALQDGE